MSRGMSVSSLLVVLLAIAPVASAQAVDPAQPPACHHGRRGGGPGGRAEFLIHTLGLDEHQAEMVRQIFTETQPERERIRAMTPGSPEQIAARQALEEQTHARIDALLDDTQRAQLARMREWHRTHGPGSGGGHGRMHGRHGGGGRSGRGMPPTGI